jgi:hypothetical protein
LLRDNAKYRGEPFDPFVLSTTDVWAWLIENRRKSVGSQGYGLRRLRFDPARIVIVVDDGADKPVKRLEYKFHGNRQHQVIVIAQADLDKLPGIPRYAYHLLSELPAPPPQPRCASNRPKVRMFRVGNYYSGGSTLGEHSRTEIEQIDDPVVCVADNFVSPTLARIWSSGLLTRNDFVVVNKGDAKKLKNFRRVEDLFQERLDAALADTPHLAEYLALSRDGSFNELFNFIGHYRSQLNLTPAQMRRPFGKIVSIYDTYMTGSKASKLAQYVEPRMPARLKPAKLVEQFQEQQWQAQHIISKVTYKDNRTIQLLKELL